MRKIKRKIVLAYEKPLIILRIVPEAKLEFLYRLPSVSLKVQSGQIRSAWECTIR